jgi:hypothetical protein
MGDVFIRHSGIWLGRMTPVDSRGCGWRQKTGVVVGRLLEGLFLLIFKMEIHCWHPLDSFFRTITARRNPNLILLSLATLMGRPDVGLVLVAVWTALCIGFHMVRLLQALFQRWHGFPIHEWQEVQGRRTDASK